MNAIFPDPVIPAHVPPELVKLDFPFIFGLTTDKDPFNELAMSVHEGPDIVYAPFAYPGGQPAWVGVVTNPGPAASFTWTYPGQGSYLLSVTATLTNGSTPEARFTARSLASIAM